MASSETEIVNSALSKLGANRVLTLDDDSKEARLAKVQYPIKRDELLRSHPWNFATARAALAKTANTPAYEFTSEFILPSDCLRVLNTDLNLSGSSMEEPYKVETNLVDGTKVLLTNTDAVNIQYLAKVTNVQLFDAVFCEALAWKLAADLAYPLVQSTSLAAQMFQISEQVLSQARSFDGQEGSVDQVQADDWFWARV